MITRQTPVDESPATENREEKKEMFWHYVVPGTFVAYIVTMLILIAVFSKLGMYDDN